MALQAGQLRNRGIVKCPPTQLDSRGQRSGEWEKVCTVWFGIDPTGGGETTVARQQQGTSNYVLVCHYSPRIQRGQRIYTRDSVLEISYVENVGMANRELRIIASEVT
ncbi:phage head closure protein [Bremerella cremea]|uniref:phage head closure protein n=1 Tax=Bremerella cremea TaxID=1031537 RepID=UPI0031E6EE0A